MTDGEATGPGSEIRGGQDPPRRPSEQTASDAQSFNLRVEGIYSIRQPVLLARRTPSGSGPDAGATALAVLRLGRPVLLRSRGFGAAHHCV